jgi:L-ascorbate metabolism protein UlaG (beta-lactamase superfamily)
MGPIGPIWPFRETKRPQKRHQPPIIAHFVIPILILAALYFGGRQLLKHPRFGRLPSGARLERIKRSPNYRDGQFHNLSVTPNLAEGYSYTKIMWEFFMGSKAGQKPKSRIPSTRTDLFDLDPIENVLVWFGHSSYFMQLDGKRMLVDPVLSGHASPFSFTTNAFPGTDRYTPEDIPPIDLLFISHDHWDHLDYEAIIALKPKIGKIITGLGTGEHFESWGFDPSMIIEEDWNTRINLGEGFIVTTVPGRHFSGRLFSRNRALWTSFVLETPTKKIFIGGDSGYDTHFAKVGKQYGPFDLAILENGQYNEAWRYIHMLPDELPIAARDLNAKRVLAVHSGKFVLANHSWKEPLTKAVGNFEREGIPLITPMIGERVDLNDTSQRFTKWWESVD